MPQPLYVIERTIIDPRTAEDRMFEVLMELDSLLVRIDDFKETIEEIKHEVALVWEEM